MHIRGLAAAAMICLGVPAVADFVTVVEAYEVELADLRLPGNSGGTLSFKACDDCEYQTVRVTGETRYQANGRNFTLEGFRKELEAAASPRDEHAIVMHHLESDTITAVRVSF